MQRVKSRPEKGLPELERYMKELLRAEEFEKIESIASYFIFRSAHATQTAQFKLGLVQGLESISYIMREK